MAHVLADYFELKNATLSQRKPITKKTVNIWVSRGWKNKNPQLFLPKPKDYYDDYIKECQAKVPYILNGPVCPKPALPLQVLSLATKDALNFSLK